MNLGTSLADIAPRKQGCDGSRGHKRQYSDEEHFLGGKNMPTLNTLTTIEIRIGLLFVFTRTF